MMIESKARRRATGGQQAARQSFPGNLLAFCAHCTAKVAATQAGACFRAECWGRGAE